VKEEEEEEEEKEDKCVSCRFSFLSCVEIFLLLLGRQERKGREEGRGHLAVIRQLSPSVESRVWRQHDKLLLLSCYFERRQQQQQQPIDGRRGTR